MTIVPNNILNSDPQHLLYHFPNISPIRYTKLSSEYHYWKAVNAAEQTAKMFGRCLVPSTLIHWERKLRLADRRIQIWKNAFFALSLEEMTSNELRKYKDIAQEEEKVMA